MRSRRRVLSEGVLSGAITLICSGLTGCSADHAPTPSTTTATAAATATATALDTPVVGPLEGTWDHVYSPEDLDVLAGYFGGSAEIGGLGPVTRTRLGFVGADWWQGFVAGGQVWKIGGVPEGDKGSFTIDGGTLTTDNGESVVVYAWSVEGASLSLTMIECTTAGAPCPDAEVVRWMTERTYTRSGTDGEP